MTPSFILSFLGKIVKSKWFWFILLATGVVILFLLWQKSIREANRWENNYNATSTFFSTKSQEVTLDKQEFKQYVRENKELKRLLKDEKIKKNRINYVHEIKWKTVGGDTVEVHDTIFVTQDGPVAGEHTELKDSCISITYDRVKGTNKGKMEYEYNGDVTIISYWEYSKPGKFWKWLTGNKTYVVEVSSPCISDTNIVLNKKTTVKH